MGFFSHRMMHQVLATAAAMLAFCIPPISEAYPMHLGSVAIEGNASIAVIKGFGAARADAGCLIQLQFGDNASRLDAIALQPGGGLQPTASWPQHGGYASLTSDISIGASSDGSGTTLIAGSSSTNLTLLNATLGSTTFIGPDGGGAQPDPHGLAPAACLAVSAPACLAASGNALIAYFCADGTSGASVAISTSAPLVAIEALHTFVGTRYAIALSLSKAWGSSDGAVLYCYAIGESHRLALDLAAVEPNGSWVDVAVAPGSSRGIFYALTPGALQVWQVVESGQSVVLTQVVPQVDLSRWQGQRVVAGGGYAAVLYADEFDVYNMSDLMNITRVAGNWPQGVSAVGFDGDVFFAGWSDAAPWGAAMLSAWDLAWDDGGKVTPVLTAEPPGWGGNVTMETDVPWWDQGNTTANETDSPGKLVPTAVPAGGNQSEACLVVPPLRPGVHLISQSDEDAAELRTKISSDMGVSCGCAGVRVQQRREQGLPMLGVEAVAGCPAMDEADDVTDREGVRVMLRMTLSQLCSAGDVQAAAALPADNIIAAAEVNTVLQPIKGKPPVLDGPTRTINLLAEGVSGVRGVDSSGALAGSVREVMLNRLGGGLVQLAGCNVVQTEVHAAGPATRCRVTVSATPTPSASASVTAPQLAAALGFSETRLYDLFTDQKGQTRFTLRDAVGDTSGENLCAVVRSKLVNGTGLAFKEAVPSQPPVLKRFQLCQRSQSSRPPLYGNVHDLGRELQVPASAIRNIVSLAEVRECHVLREVEVAMYGDVAAQTGNWPYAVLQEDTVNAPRRFFKGKVIASNGPMSLTAVDLAAVLRVLEERVYVHENAEFAFETTAPIASTTAAAAELVKQGLVARQYANIRNVLLQEADPSEAFLIDLCRNIDHHHALVLRKPVCNSCPPVLAPITNSPRAAPSDDAADASTVATTLIIALAMVAAAVIAAVVFLRRHKPVKFGDLVNDLDEDTYEEGRDDSI